MESRETTLVAEWLKTYPNIKIVSRDGSAQYATAIRKAHPKAIHVSDRFHLVKNLIESAKQHLSRIVGSNLRISTLDTDSKGEYWEKEGRTKDDLPKRLYKSSTQKKEIVIDKVRNLAVKGLSLTEIATEIGISPPTVKKYMDETFNPANVQYHTKRSSPLKPYTSIIDEMLCAKRKFVEIEAVIRAKGYKGAASTIRMYATRQRRIIQAARMESFENTEIIERKWVVKLLYQPIDKVRQITHSQVERIINEYPIIGTLYDVVHSFKEMMFAKRVHELDGWIDSVKQLGIAEINSFADGLLRDLDAVKNAIRLDYNNGLAEGHINKLKLIKRTMYGRHSFKLLRNKLLLLEYSRACN